MTWTASIAGLKSSHIRRGGLAAAVVVAALAGGLTAAAPAGGRIDELLAASVKDTDLRPVTLIDDTTYLRRVTIDLIGRVPTVAEQRLYESEPAGTRRLRLVERLVATDRFADRWAVWLGDMLRARSGAVGGPELDRFLRRSMRDRVPYDHMVRQLLTAVGTSGHDGAIGYFAAVDADPLEMAGLVAQTLLGIRMKCARCHDHPFDRWSQREYYELAAFFGSTRAVRGAPDRPVRMVDSSGQRVTWPPRDGPHAGGSPSPVEPHWPLPSAAAHEPTLAAAIGRARLTKEPTTDQAIEELLVAAVADASPTGGLANEAVVVPTGAGGAGGLRRTLADRVADPRNRSFARNVVNRLWATLIGRGLVDPVDDHRDDNPPRHPEVLDHLADELVASGHDLRHVVTIIVTSDAYARGHATDEDLQQRRRLEDACLAAPLRPLPAEALHDSLVAAGHLHAVKHPPGANPRTVVERVLVRREPATSAADEEEGDASGGRDAAALAEAVLGGRLAVADADDEPDMGDLTAAMTDVDPLGGMRAMSLEDARRLRMADARQRAGGSPAPLPQSAEEVARLYRVETVTKQVDINPQFPWAIDMPLPAPPQHFLRLLGQSPRVDDDAFESRPHMRQALMLLNGPLVHEAARVGPLEPLGRAIAAGGRSDVVGMLYRETLARSPTDEERAVADEVIAAADSTADGVADLRWAIFNSREFRFIP